MEKSKIDIAYAYYKTHKAELVKKYRDKFVVISDNKVLLAHDNQLEATQQALKSGLTLGDFIVQQVSEDDLIQRFHSRVAL